MSVLWMLPLSTTLYHASQTGVLVLMLLAIPRCSMIRPCSSTIGIASSHKICIGCDKTCSASSTLRDVKELAMKQLTCLAILSFLNVNHINELSPLRNWTERLSSKLNAFLCSCSGVGQMTTRPRGSGMIEFGDAINHFLCFKF